MVGDRQWHIEAVAGHPGRGAERDSADGGGAWVTLAEQEAGFPLTVRLDSGDTGFPKPTWVRVTDVRSLRRDELEEPIVTLSEERMDEVTAALAKVLDMSGPPRSLGVPHPANQGGAAGLRYYTEVTGRDDA